MVGGVDVRGGGTQLAETNVDLDGVERYKAVQPMLYRFKKNCQILLLKVRTRSDKG